MEKRILIAKEAAELIRVSEQRLYQLCREEAIPFILLGQRQYRFSKHRLEEWLENGGNKKEVTEDDK